MNAPELTAAIEAKVQPAGVVRRLGAMVYDGMLVMAVLAVATIPFLVIAPRKIVIPSEVGWGLYLAYLFWQMIVIASFFGFFWTRRGQTLGMQVWKLRVEDERGNLLSWPQALLRLLYATLPWLPAYVCLSIAEQLHSSLLKRTGAALLLLAAANLVVLKFSRDQRSWHDKLSHSRVVRF